MFQLLYQINSDRQWNIRLFGEAIFLSGFPNVSSSNKLSPFSGDYQIYTWPSPFIMCPLGTPLLIHKEGEATFFSQKQITFHFHPLFVFPVYVVSSRDNCGVHLSRTALRKAIKQSLLIYRTRWSLWRSFPT